MNLFAYYLRRLPRGGFTLIELSIVLLVTSLLLAGVVSIENRKLRVSQQEELKRKMDMIEKALYQYRIVNNKLPCPGDSRLALSAANFGLQSDGAAENCHDGGTIDSNLNLTDGGNSVFGGSVPVRTLGLPDDVAYDPWGRLFTYYIDKEANNSTNFTGINGTAGVTDTNLLNVVDDGGTTITDDVLAVVLSHGPNGHGAYNVAGSRVSSGSTNVKEQENCMCNSSAGAVADNTALTIHMQRNITVTAGTRNTEFDDIVRYYNKKYFYTYAERYL